MSAPFIHSCSDCRHWEIGAYTNAETEDGRSFGECRLADCEDGTPEHPETMIVGTGTWGEECAATHPDHWCRNWLPKAPEGEVPA